MWAASFDTSVPVMPMAIPMSARFSAGASLTPSPSLPQTDPYPEALGLHDLQLLFRGNTGVYPYVLNFLFKLF